MTATITTRVLSLQPEESVCSACLSSVDTTEMKHDTDYNEMLCPECYITEGLAECDNCGCHTRKHETSHDGYTLCMTCFREENFICEHCGEAAHITEETHTTEGPVCENCLEDDFIMCNSCEDWILREDALESEDTQHMYCSTCAGRELLECERCERLFEHGSSLYTVNGNLLFCEECIHDSCTQCDECGEWIFDDDVIRCHGDRLCEDCYDNAEEERLYSTNIESYNFKPLWNLHRAQGEHEHEPYLGFELEIDDGEYRGELAERITEEYAGLLFCKHDGSLSADNGLEIVSHPGTIRYWSTTNVIENLCNLCREYNYLSYSASSSCGFHIHVTDDYFKTANHMIKLHLFYFLPTNKQLVCSIMGRGFNSYAKNKGKIEDLVKEGQVFSATIGGETELATECTQTKDRFEAINLCPKHTVEFRQGKGTLKASTLRERLEFIRFLVEWTDRYGMQFYTLKNAKKVFFQDLEREKEAYPNLFRKAETLKSRGML